MLVAMSCSEDRPVEHAMLRSTLIIWFMASTKSNVQVSKCVSNSAVWFSSSPWTTCPTPTCLTSSMQLIQSYIANHQFSVRTHIGILPTQSIPLEPYHLISPSSVCQLFNSSMANQAVPVSILQEIQKHNLSAQQESTSVQGAEGVYGQHEYLCW